MQETKLAISLILTAVATTSVAWGQAAASATTTAALPPAPPPQATSPSATSTAPASVAPTATPAPAPPAAAPSASVPPAPARPAAPARPPSPNYGYPPSGYPSGYPAPGYGYPPSGYPPPYYGQWSAPGYPQWQQSGAPRYSPQRPDATARLHDGFYMRMSIGGGYVHARQAYEPGGQVIVPTISGQSVPLSTSEIGVGGAATSFDIVLGGTPINGVVVAGAFIFNSSPSPDVTVGDITATSDSDLTFWLPSLYVDIFPNPTGGFHLGGIAGIAIVDWGKSGAGSSASGVGGGAFVGYDAWVGNQWAFGGLVRAIGAVSSDNDYDGRVKYTVANIALLATALYQ